MPSNLWCERYPQHRDPISEACALLDENERRTSQDHDLIPVSSLTDPLAMVAYLTLPDLEESDVTVEIERAGSLVELTFVCVGGPCAGVRVAGSTMRVRLSDVPGEQTYGRSHAPAVARAVLAHVDPYPPIG